MRSARQILTMAGLLALLHGYAVAQPAGGGTEKIGNAYRINGQWYRPTDDRELEQEGVASWYGAELNGRRTANGETFDMNEMTAAHRTLPLPSWVEVTNLDTGKQIVVRVNDRGPFHSKRIIDLSRRAAQMLGFGASGQANVRIRRVYPAAAPPPLEEAVNAPTAGVDGALLAPPPIVPEPVALRDDVLARTPGLGGPLYYVQVASVGTEKNARALAEDLDHFGPVDVVTAPDNGRARYRVRLGPFASLEAANAILADLKSAGYSDALVVNIVSRDLG